MTNDQMIANAKAKGWRIEKTREGKTTWFRGLYHDGRRTRCATQSLASTMRLIDAERFQKGVRMSVEEAEAWFDLTDQSVEEALATLAACVASDNDADVYATAEAASVLQKVAA